MTLAEHLAAQRSAVPEYAGGAAAIIQAIGWVARDIARALAYAAIRGDTGKAGSKNTTGDEQKPLDLWSHEVMAGALRGSHACAPTFRGSGRAHRKAEGAGPPG